MLKSTLTSILRAIVVLCAGSWGIGACILGVFAIAFANDSLGAGRWAELTAFGVGLIVVGIALVWVAWRVLSPPIPPTDDAELNQQKAFAIPRPVVVVLALAALFLVAVWSWVFDSPAPRSCLLRACGAGACRRADLTGTVRSDYGHRFVDCRCFSVCSGS
jgi:hypothetical protein